MANDRIILAAIDLALTVLQHADDIEQMIRGLDVDPNDKEEMLRKIRQLRKSIKRWDDRLTVSVQEHSSA